MSKFVDKEMTCNICGHICQVTILTATTTEGSADLDFRPPEKRRSAMPLWVHKCELCGAVLSVYETTPNVGQEFIASNKYQTCAGIGGLSENGKKFVKIALIYEQAGQMKKAGNYFLNAAWCCDDEGMDVNAKLCREEALRCWNEMGRGELNNREMPEMQVKILDTLRRSGNFKEARAFAKCMDTSNEQMQQIVAFEVSKAVLKDKGCYTLADAVMK